MPTQLGHDVSIVVGPVPWRAGRIELQFVRPRVVPASTYPAAITGGDVPSLSRQTGVWPRSRR